MHTVILLLLVLTTAQVLVSNAEKLDTRRRPPYRLPAPGHHTLPSPPSPTESYIIGAGSTESPHANCSRTVDHQIRIFSQLVPHNMTGFALVGGAVGNRLLKQVYGCSSTIRPGQVSFDPDNIARFKFSFYLGFSSTDVPSVPWRVLEAPTTWYATTRITRR